MKTKWRIVLQAGPPHRVEKDPPFYFPTYGTIQSPNWTPGHCQSRRIPDEKRCDFLLRSHKASIYFWLCSSRKGGLMIHDTIVDVTSSGHARITCSNCRTSIVRQPYMTADKWEEIKSDWFKLHPPKYHVCGHSQGERIYSAPANYPPRCKEDPACQCLRCPWAQTWLQSDPSVKNEVSK